MIFTVNRVLGRAEGRTELGGTVLLTMLGY